MQDHTTNESTNEEWKDIPGYPNYQASSHGRIRSLPRTIKQRSRFGAFFLRRIPGKILESVPQKNGYRYVRPCFGDQKEKVPVHRLIAITFLGPQPDNHVAHHLNREKLDNRPENLQYVHKKAHARYHGKEAEATQYQTRLTEKQVKEIIQLSAAGLAQTKIAPQFGISQAYVSAILSGKARCWQHLISNHCS